MLKHVATVLAAVAVGFVTIPAQQAPAPTRDTLPDNPGIFDSSTRGPNGRPIAGPKFRVVTMKGLQRPYALAFLPDGSILITERAGRLRIMRNNVLDPQPIGGMPEVLDQNLKGLNDIALHPDFARNRILYFTYYKPAAGSQNVAAGVLARARFEGGHALTEVKDIFITSQLIDQPSAARLVFGRDGKIYVGIGVPIPARTTTDNIATTTDAQSPRSHFGKILRLNDDGTPAADNPFAGKPEYKPEIYALGIRNTMGLAIHPETGEIWETENGPQGGDELNVIRAGKNYGWPTISHGRSYTGDVTGATGPVTDPPVAPGLEQPMLFWAPSIALSGLTFYTADQFPEWKGSVFVGGLVGTQLQRIVMNERGLPIRRDIMLYELRQRIRDVRQGPDGLIYVLTDEEHGALLRLEPVSAGS